MAGARSHRQGGSCPGDHIYSNVIALAAAAEHTLRMYF